MRLKVWKMKPIEVARTLGELALPQPGQVLAAELDGAGGGPVQRAEDLQQRALAVAGGSLDGQPVAVGDDQVHAVAARARAAALLIVLGDTAELVHDGYPFSGCCLDDSCQRRCRAKPDRPPAAE